MLIPFEPRFTITPSVVNALIRTEAVRQSMADLPITPLVLKRCEKQQGSLPLITPR